MKRGPHSVADNEHVRKRQRMLKKSLLADCTMDSVQKECRFPHVSKRINKKQEPAMISSVHLPCHTAGLIFGFNVGPSPKYEPHPLIFNYSEDITIYHIMGIFWEY